MLLSLESLLSSKSFSPSSTPNLVTLKSFKVEFLSGKLVGNFTSIVELMGSKTSSLLHCKMIKEIANHTNILKYIFFIFLKNFEKL